MRKQPPKKTSFETNKKGSVLDIQEDTSITAIKLLRIVIDLSGSVENFRDDMIKLVKESLYILKNSLSCKILLSISVFSTHHRVIVPFTDVDKLDIESISFPKAAGYTRTGQALLESVDEAMTYYEKLKNTTKGEGTEVYPPMIFTITDGKNYGGAEESEKIDNLRKYREAELKIKSYEKLPPLGLDKLYFYACALDGMLGSASKQELQQLTNYPERIFTTTSRDCLKKKLAEIMYVTITVPTQIL